MYRPWSRLTNFCPSCRIACAVGFLLLGMGYLVGWPLLRSPSSAGRMETGRLLYAQHCAACHGVNLEGQPNWQTRSADGKLPAPPHDDSGHTWHHSDEQLFKLTKFGVSAVVPGYKSDMLGFGDKLSDEQIRPYSHTSRAGGPSLTKSISQNEISIISDEHCSRVRVCPC
jgi:mono/diheme cytochrome c family protein